MLKKNTLSVTLRKKIAPKQELYLTFQCNINYFFYQCFLINATLIFESNITITLFQLFNKINFVKILLFSSIYQLFLICKTIYNDTYLKRESIKELKMNFAKNLETQNTITYIKRKLIMLLLVVGSRGVGQKNEKKKLDQYLFMFNYLIGFFVFFFLFNLLQLKIQMRCKRVVSNTIQLNYIFIS